MTMERRLMGSLARPRLYALLFGSFATFALLIAGIGLFGGLSYGVTQRTRRSVFARHWRDAPRHHGSCRSRAPS
jgi:hypothetical protein